MPADSYDKNEKRIDFQLYCSFPFSSFDSGL